MTDPNAAMTFLAPDHPVLNQPNKITQADFAGWVQERGLIFQTAGTIILFRSWRAATRAKRR